MPEEFLLSHVGFDDGSRPFIECQTGDEKRRASVLGAQMALRFDFSERWCTGWLDFENRCSRACPDSAMVDGKYDQCLTCRNRTGFNPAFYHAAEVSEQQQKLNQTPHYLYLAYLAPGVVKVGISQAARGIKRLLEQGARAAVRLETFPTALVARQYEAKIAGLNGFVEHVTQGKKLGFLQQVFDAEQARAELERAMASVERELHVRFEAVEFIDTEQHFYHRPTDATRAKDVSGQECIVGEVRAMVGPLLITEWQDELLVYNLKRYIGYRAQHDETAAVALPEEQLALF